MFIYLCFLLQAIFMLKFVSLLFNPDINLPEPGVGIILQQNTSVLLLQDIYTGSWGFSTFYIEKFNPSQLDIFGAIQQLREDTSYSGRFDFIITGPPCKYGKNYYWYANLQTLEPPKLNNKKLYQNVKFMSRQEILKYLYYPTYDVEIWMDEGMPYSCLNRNSIYR